MTPAEETPKAITPTFLYHKTAREGRVFTTAEALTAAQAAGWVDTPAKLPPVAEDGAQAPSTAPAAPATPAARKDVLKMTVDQVAAAVADETNPAALTAILKRERTRTPKPRKGIVEAVEARLEALEAA